MELSKFEKEMISLFKTYKATEDEVIIAMLLLRKPSQQKALMNWVETNSPTTTSQIMREVENIYKTNN